MDFGTMMQNLNSGKYSTMEEFSEMLNWSSAIADSSIRQQHTQSNVQTL
jgi:hypothetical protein